MEIITESNNHVMIVDDDPSIRMVMSAILESFGMSVEEAEDGEQALKLLEKVVPDLLLLDVTMPGMNGFEVYTRIKKTPLISEIPIVMVTGCDDTFSIQRAWDMGVTDFIAKPISLSLFGYRINFLMRATKAFASLKKIEKRLTHAEHLAGLGTWEWELQTDKMWFSDEMQQIFHYDPLSFDASFQAFISSVHPVDRQRVLAATSDAIKLKSSYSIDHQLLLCDGKSCFVHTEASVIIDQNGVPVRLEGAIQDISVRKAAEEEIRQLAFFDTLTSLPNRAFFLEHLNRIHFKSQTDKNKFAILFIDIDGFKTINDTLGHISGDCLLQKLALRLKESVRSDDFTAKGMVARLGGDEFVVVIEHLKNSEDAAIVAQRIIANTSIPVKLEASEVVVTASIGISIFPDDGHDTDTLISHADIAMYSAKDNGKNSFQYFSSSMHEAATLQLELEKELRMAIFNDEFTMYYQAQVDLLTRKIMGFEALIRWNNAKLGDVSPAVFIPMAEKNNLIWEIDRWVFSEVCRQIRNWQDYGVTGLQIAVNLSGRSITNKDLVPYIRQEMKKYTIEPQSLQIEITEGVLMSDSAASSATLRELKNIGISLAIDDFGTGYSSLLYLQSLPVDIIKIDQSFIFPIADINDRVPVVSAIIALAGSLEMDVIAEGIEREVQCDFLAIHGCAMGQGYLFSRPVLAEYVPALCGLNPNFKVS